MKHKFSYAGPGATLDDAIRELREDVRLRLRLRHGHGNQPAWFAYRELTQFQGVRIETKGIDRNGKPIFLSFYEFEYELYTENTRVFRGE